VIAWMQPGRYVIGQEIVAAGLAEMLDPAAPMVPATARSSGAKRRKKKPRKDRG
jgi:hypothetical protein